MKALVVPLDGFTGALLAGPAVRAVATRAHPVTVLCGPGGEPAARLLPHVDDVVVWEPPPRTPEDGRADDDPLVRRLRNEAYDVALVLAPGGHSPGPAEQLLLRARVHRVAACGDTRPRAVLGTAAALGFRPRAGDDGRLRVVPPPDTAQLTGAGPYVVVHPGAGPPGHAWDPDHCAAVVSALADAGHRVVVTGGPEESALTRHVSADIAVDLGGRTDPRRFAGVLRAADAVVTGAPGPAHLAAATGTPVVSLVPPGAPRRPDGVPSVLLAPDACTARDVAGAVHRLLDERT
ncbi:glycosyltransferase family 9 protein [Streptomyces sp. NPDC052687]|uniref:glycosyltransferase family 9 protein n=1 Tax=Streptomyces sp. NPDC052687 TaxID=3154759 RepID=UPI00341B9EB0